MKRPGQYKVPFDEGGNLMHYPGGWTRGLPSTIDWRDNVVFRADLEITSTIGTGMSAKYAWWENRATGVLYPMFVVDLVGLCREAVVIQGKVTDRFAVRKRGQNYGLILWRNA